MNVKSLFSILVTIVTLNTGIYQSDKVVATTLSTSSVNFPMVTGNQQVIALMGKNTIYFGEGYQAEADDYHLNIKPKILKAAGNFAGRVGKNPDTKVINNIIVLTGTGDFKGKSFTTTLPAGDYLSK